MAGAISLLGRRLLAAASVGINRGLVIQRIRPPSAWLASQVSAALKATYPDNSAIWRLEENCVRESVT